MNLNRKSIRLKNYDYSQEGAYFITICTHDRKNLFGNISVGVGRDRPDGNRDRPVDMQLNEIGKIVESVWESLPDHHPVELDAFQIMPNHVHFVIVTGGSRPNDSGGSRPAPTLGTVIGLFKSACTKQINNVRVGRDRPIWQRNYYEHIIRNEDELYRIQEYIQTNPQMWERDRNNLKGTGVKLDGSNDDVSVPDFGY